MNGAKKFLFNKYLTSITVRLHWNSSCYSTNVTKCYSRANVFTAKSRICTRYFSSNESGNDKIQTTIPKESDILVIGGGAVGLSVAYWLKQRHPTGFSLTVVEQDPHYTTCSSTRAVGGIRQQFSLKENIQMSMFSAEFLKELSTKLRVLGMDTPDVHFTPQGYLFLANKDQAPIMESNHAKQLDCGAQVELLNKDSLTLRYPWLNCEDLALGSYGLQNEGWFDPWLLLATLKAKCIDLGAQFVQGKVVDFKMHGGRRMIINGETHITKRITDAVVEVDGKTHAIQSSKFINCTGCWSKEIGLLANIGNGPGALEVPIPVEKRKRFVFMFHCPNGPGLDMPMLIDPSGVYVRREGLGGHFICGKSPTYNEEEPSTDNLDITESDYNLFYKDIWPTLANRIPAFENLKLKSAWAGYYDYNTMDQNLIIGSHPYHINFYMACGSSGHGLQHSLAIGRAMMELVIDDSFQTIDLSNFSFDRVLYDEPVYEVNIV